MFKFSRKEVVHGLMALGTGVGVLAYEVANIAANPYVDAGCYALIATLASLGVGIARRSA